MRGWELAAELLKEWRLARGMTQTQMAVALRVSQPDISDLERGAKRPGLVWAVRIEALTDIPVQMWVDEEAA